MVLFIQFFIFGWQNKNKLAGELKVRMPALFLVGKTKISWLANEMRMPILINK